MKRMPLTNSKKTFIIDDEDYDRVRVWNWYLNDSGNTLRICAYIYGKIITLPRFLLNKKKSQSYYRSQRQKSFE